ncbi:MAG: glycosyltransferase family 2 protein [Dehalococcoidales bacterium]|nr:glycosyltransferase family 2 protein [Dehalococcoidales bacterium]
MASISVVLPAYNEQDNISRTVGNVVEALDGLSEDYEILVVDDGSRDRTAAVTTDLAERYPRVRLVQHPVNKGYGAALATGFASARKDLVFMTDGDAQFDVREIANLLPLMADADLAIGYRAPRVDPFHRLAYAWGWKVLINLLFGYTARDVDCAFKLFRRSIMEDFQVESRGATFSTEFLVRARRTGHKVSEVAVKHLPRTAGKPTGGRPDVVIRAFRELIKFRWRLWTEPKGAMRCREGT